MLDKIKKLKQFVTRKLPAWLNYMPKYWSIHWAKQYIADDLIIDAKSFIPVRNEPSNLFIGMAIYMISVHLWLFPFFLLLFNFYHKKFDKQVNKRINKLILEYKVKISDIYYKYIYTLLIYIANGSYLYL